MSILTTIFYTSFGLISIAIIFMLLTIQKIVNFNPTALLLIAIILVANGIMIYSTLSIPKPQPLTDSQILIQTILEGEEETVIT